jgi:hypothetical protein
MRRVVWAGAVVAAVAAYQDRKGPSLSAPAHEGLRASSREHNAEVGLAAVQSFHGPNEPLTAWAVREPLKCARNSADILSTSLCVTALGRPANAAQYRFTARQSSPAASGSQVFRTMTGPQRRRVPVRGELQVLVDIQVVGMVHEKIARICGRRTGGLGIDQAGRDQGLDH